MALEWIQGVHAKKLLADQVYDSDKIVEAARKTKMEGCIPSKRNRKVQQEINKGLYRTRMHF